jgi:16S rRNA (guanine(527)-N(7))-methyltransferase RsmG
LSVKDRGKIFSRHFLDALVLSGKIPLKAGTVMDLGSGNGIPAIPVAIFRSDLKVYCFESRIKKAAFLNNIKNKLALENLFIINDRIENNSNNFNNYFDYITARAFSSVEEIISLSRTSAKKTAFFFYFNDLLGKKQNNTQQKPTKDINIVDKYVYKLPDGITRVLLSFKLI